MNQPPKISVTIIFTLLVLLLVTVGTAFSAYQQAHARSKWTKFIRKLQGKSNKPAPAPAPAPAPVPQKPGYGMPGYVYPVGNPWPIYPPGYLYSCPSKIPATAYFTPSPSVCYYSPPPLPVPGYGMPGYVPGP